MTWGKTRVCIHGKRKEMECLECGEDREFFDHRRVWEARQVVSGNCVRCGQPKGDSPYKRKCKKCGPMAAKWQRGKTGARKWLPGSVGRPPLVRQGD
jgi:hypothetical protein